jgi:hypothetical protein
MSRGLATNLQNWYSRWTYKRAILKARDGGADGEGAKGRTVPHTTFRLMPEDRALLDALGRELGTGPTGVFRAALRQLARQLGIQGEWQCRRTP